MNYDAHRMAFELACALGVPESEVPMIEEELRDAYEAGATAQQRRAASGKEGDIGVWVPLVTPEDP